MSDVGEAEPTIVTMVWEEVSDELVAHLVRYVVVSRSEAGCRNIDLCASVTAEGRIVIIEKWATPEAQRTHTDGPALLELAAAARDLDAARPAMDLLEGISAHDLT